MKLENSDSSLHTNPRYKMYVERFGHGKNGAPAVLFIHGAYHTGMCYMRTPDGRTGWAPMLAGKNLTVYVTDLPDMGRSGSVPFASMSGEFVVEAYADLIKSLPEKIILVTHSMSGAYGFKLAELLPEKIVAVVSVEPSLPGNFEDVIVPDSESDRVLKVKFFDDEWDLDMNKYFYPTPGQIQSFVAEGTTQFATDDNCLAEYKASLQAIHPRLVYERLNIADSQLKINDFSKLLPVKFLVLSSPANPRHLHTDEKIPKEFRARKIEVDHYKLDKLGIFGNGHMMMLEKNNAEILDKIVEWLKEKKLI